MVARRAREEWCGPQQSGQRIGNGAIASGAISLGASGTQYLEHQQLQRRRTLFGVSLERGQGWRRVGGQVAFARVDQSIEMLPTQAMVSNRGGKRRQHVMA